MIKRSAPYISNITPLRGIAALLVVICHYDDFVVRFVPRSSSMFFGKCYLMVDLFFIMSGLVITHVYQDRFRSQVTKNDFKKFAIARFARVYPLHFFTLFIIVLSFLTSGMHVTSLQDPKALPANLFLLQACGVLNHLTWNGPSWSISAEWWSYMLFPFLLLLLDKKKKLVAPIMILFSFVIYFSIMYLLPRSTSLSFPGAIPPHNLNVFYDYGFLRGLSGFMLGMLLYKLYEFPYSKKLFNSDFSFILFSFGTFLCMHFAVSDLLCIPLLAGVVISATCNDGKVSLLFKTRPLQLIGDISYSLYMIHIIVLFTILGVLKKQHIQLPERPYNDVPFWPGFLGCLAFLVLMIPLSYLSYRMIEDPCRNFINRKLKRPV